MTEPETPPPAPETPAPASETPPAGDTPTLEELIAERDKWKHFAREHESKAKANEGAAQKLAEIEEANKTEAQKLADAATAATQRAAAAETALARLKVASAKGLPSELADRLQGANEQEMAEDADRLLAVMKPTTPPPPGSADGGPQGTGDPSKPKQLTRSDLAAMTPDQIVEAKAKGQLDDLLGIT
jgi:hypothetical protein